MTSTPPRKPSELRTMGRTSSEMIKGKLLIVFGFIICLVGAVSGLASGNFGSGGLLIIAFGGILIVIGSEKIKKATHVAWTMEAIEREKYISGTEFKCPNCGKWTLKGGKFCSSCGGILMIVCVKCGVSNEKTAKFCISCGTPIKLVSSRKGAA